MAKLDLESLMNGPRTSEPIDAAPWLRQVDEALAAAAPTSAVGVVAQAVKTMLAGADSAQTADALRVAQAHVLMQIITSLCSARELLMTSGDAKALEQCELLIGALGLAHEDVRLAATTNREVVRRTLARLVSA